MYKLSSCQNIILSAGAPQTITHYSDFDNVTIFQYSHRKPESQLTNAHLFQFCPQLSQILRVCPGQRTREKYTHS